MWRRRLIFAAAAAALTGPLAWAGLDDLAGEDRWVEVLALARLRVHQLPLQPAEALVAAEAARRLGDTEARALFLELAGESEDLGAVARVELAEMLAEEDPARCAELALSLIASSPTAEIRNGATGAAARAIYGTLGREERVALGNAARRIRRGGGREVELALALTGDAGRRRALVAVLDDSTSDGVALRAALALAENADLGPSDRWLVARTFYRHAMYEQSAAELERLEAQPHQSVPAWEVAFTRGRCAFRRDEWEAAAAWYRKALSRTGSRRRKSELEVHLGRTLELGGDGAAARAAARRALSLQPSDDRRLLLIRMLLKAGDGDDAAVVTSAVRSRSKRDRARLLLALDHLRRNRREEAASALQAVRRSPWRPPARVLAATIAVSSGDERKAVELLDEAVGPWMDRYWAAAARRVMADLGAETRAAWILSERQSSHGLEGSDWRRKVAGRAVLETDPDELGAIATRLEAESGLAGDLAQPAFESGPADGLWRLGLRDLALRWDPGGLPRTPPVAALWTAGRLIESGHGREGSRMAERLREEIAPEVPWWVLPQSLQRSLYPLPLAEEVAAAATESGVPWSLLAAVASVESRWEAGALSVVGARGLTQLMPDTAHRAAEALGMGGVAPDLLFDPALSLRLGAAELARLLETFGGRRGAAVAAYNAGEAQTRLWLEACGEPCTEDVFVLTVSFRATRGYTAEVLTAAGAYEQLYGEGMNALIQPPKPEAELPVLRGGRW